MVACFASLVALWIDFFETVAVHVESAASKISSAYSVTGTIAFSDDFPMRMGFLRCTSI
jgi:hypothetical protein